VQIRQQLLRDQEDARKVRPLEDLPQGFRWFLLHRLLKQRSYIRDHDTPECVHHRFPKQEPNEM
jgi:hypothetical protein